MTTSRDNRPSPKAFSQITMGSRWAGPIEEPSPATRDEMSKDDDPVVGHITFGAPGRYRHEPLRQSEANRLMELVDQEKQQRAKEMPDETAALGALTDAFHRLTELGWKPIIYCPKDGSWFDAIEAGSSGVHHCHYDGEWPDGSWWVEGDGDLYPSRPILWRPSRPA